MTFKIFKRLLSSPKYDFMDMSSLHNHQSVAELPNFAVHVVHSRGRNARGVLLLHADAITNYSTAIVVALTLGQIGSSTPKTPNFMTQLYQVHHILDCLATLSS